MIDLDALLELENKAYPGPWAWRKFGGQEVLCCDERDRKFIICCGYTTNEKGVLDPMKPGQPVSDLIPAMRNNIRELCLELRAAREVVNQAMIESKDYPPSEPMSRMLDRYMEITNGQG